MKGILLVFVSFSLGACVSVQKVPIRQAFVASEAMYIMDEGPYTIAGQSFMRTVGGEVRTCAGYEVGLVPATSYAAERMRVIYGSDITGFLPVSALSRSEPASTDPAYTHYQRKTQCDANGRFTFPKTAAGAYYVITSVVWSTGQAYSPPQGGYQMRRVVAGRDSENLIISP